MYLYVHDGSGYKLDTFSPYYAQSWSYGLGAHYPPARGWGSTDHSKRSLVGLGPNSVSSNFSIGLYKWWFFWLSFKKWNNSKTFTIL